MNKLNEETLKKLSNSITNIIDAEGKQISFINAELKYNLGYWTQGKETLSLFLDGVKCQVTNTKVSYKCSCGQLNTILLKKFLLKTKLSCAHCSETKEKREHHSMVLKAKKKGIPKIIGIPFFDMKYTVTKINGRTAIIARAR